MNIILYTLLISLIINLVFFFIASIIKTDKFTDITYALTFIVLTYLAFLKGESSQAQVTLATMIILWGVRLGSFLFYRIWVIGKDKRFDEMRDKFLAFLKFWLLQALTVWVVMLPSLIALSSPKDLSLNPLMIVGMIIWLIGLSIESVADNQKFAFKQDKSNKGKWTNIGLWRLSRHPNYFGEITLWWGVYLFTLPFLSGLEYLSIIGPIFITLLITKVSGIPLLEKSYAKRFKGNKEFNKYVNNTNLLLPLKLPQSF